MVGKGRGEGREREREKRDYEARETERTIHCLEIRETLPSALTVARTHARTQGTL